MAWTAVAGQSAIGQAITGTSATASALPAAPSAGDLLIAWCLWFGGGASGTNSWHVTDASSHAFLITPSLASVYDAAAGQCAIFYRICDGTESGAGIVATFDTTLAASIELQVFRTSSGTPVFDNDALGTGTGTVVNTPTVPVSGADDVVVTIAASSTSITGANSPWTASGHSPGNFGQCAAYRLSVSTNQTVSMAQASGSWSSAAASFSAGAGVAVPGVDGWGNTSTHVAARAITRVYGMVASGMSQGQR